MTDDKPKYRPGQKIVAMVGGEEKVVILSLEDEAKGSRRDHCYRLCEPWYPLIPKEVDVVPIRPYEEPLRVIGRKLRPE